MEQQTLFPFTDALVIGRRIENAPPRPVINQSVYDEAESAFQVAETEVESAEVAVRQAQRDLTDTVVTAPYDAVVTARFIDEGVYMAATGSGANPVVKLQKIDVVRAVIKIGFKRSAAPSRIRSFRPFPCFFKAS